MRDFGLFDRFLYLSVRIKTDLTPSCPGYDVPIQYRYRDRDVYTYGMGAKGQTWETRLALPPVRPFVPLRPCKEVIEGFLI